MLYIFFVGVWCCHHVLLDDLLECYQYLAWVRNQTLYNFWFYITNFSRYPMEIYDRGWGRPLYGFFTFIIPVLLVVNIPARILARPISPQTSEDQLLIAWGIGSNTTKSLDQPLGIQTRATQLPERKLLMGHADLTISCEQAASSDGQIIQSRGITADCI